MIQVLLLGVSLAFAGSDAPFAIKVGGFTAGKPAASSVPAVVKESERVVSDRTSEVVVVLTQQTVKCSAADYQAPMLKVLVPQLAELTILNHRNTREGAPCIAAGRCTESLNPQSILSRSEGAERVPVRVVLKKRTELDGQTCRVTLVETVTTRISGIPFFHERLQDVAERSAEDCR